MVNVLKTVAEKMSEPNKLITCKNLAVLKVTNNAEMQEITFYLHKNNTQVIDNNNMTIQHTSTVPEALVVRHTKIKINKLQISKYGHPRIQFRAHKILNKNLSLADVHCEVSVLSDQFRLWFY